jgi:hypothetical protein
LVTCATCPWTVRSTPHCRGQVRRCHHSVRLPAITELREWILAAGFGGVEFRARDGQEPAIDRARLVVLATA